MWGAQTTKKLAVLPGTAAAKPQKARSRYRRTSTLKTLQPFYSCAIPGWGAGPGRSAQGRAGGWLCLDPVSLPRALPGSSRSAWVQHLEPCPALPTLPCSSYAPRCHRNYASLVNPNCASDLMISASQLFSNLVFLPNSEPDASGQ